MKTRREFLRRAAAFGLTGGVMLAGQVLPMRALAAERASSVGKGKNQPATTQANRPSTAHGAVPIVYNDSILVRALTDDQVEEILRGAGEIAPKGARVWFVLVIDNYYPLLKPTQHEFRVRVFFSPDAPLGKRGAPQPRLRRGHSAYFFSDSERPVLHDYVQVSRPGAPFGDRLDAPTLADVPFRVNVMRESKPVEISDEGIVGLTDFARLILEKHHKQPLRWINRDGDEIEVRTGVGSGGEYIKIRKTDRGYEQVGDVVLWRA